MNRGRLPVIVALLLASHFVSNPCKAQTSAGSAVAECDRLAAHPNDPGKEGAGVAFEKIDAAAAIDVCTKALAANPDHVEEVLAAGAAKVRPILEATMAEVHAAVGIGPRRG